MKQIAHKHGALLIFDEVKTGVTIAPGGATERFGVTPDLVALAKAIGGGLPCGAVGGRDDVMNVIEEKRVAQRRIGAQRNRNINIDAGHWRHFTAGKRNRRQAVNKVQPG